jgi:hypothetical protein
MIVAEEMAALLAVVEALDALGVPYAPCTAWCAPPWTPTW